MCPVLLNVSNFTEGQSFDCAQGTMWKGDHDDVDDYNRPPKELFGSHLGPLIPSD